MHGSAGDVLVLASLTYSYAGIISETSSVFSLTQNLKCLGSLILTVVKHPWAWKSWWSLAFYCQGC